jgi:Fe-S-cluster containining protein
MKTEKILSEARTSLCDFCINECKAFCCRKGRLLLNKNQLKLIPKNNLQKLKKNKVLIKINSNKFSMDFEKNNDSCLFLSKNKCMIYNHENRPRKCIDFPLFKKDNLIFLSKRCLAVQQGILYPFTLKLKKKGFKIKEFDLFLDFDFKRLNLD